jgi:hypothetical protein
VLEDTDLDEELEEMYSKSESSRFLLKSDFLLAKEQPDTSSLAINVNMYSQERGRRQRAMLDVEPLFSLHSHHPQVATSLTSCHVHALQPSPPPSLSPRASHKALPLVHHTNMHEKDVSCRDRTGGLL